MRRFILTALALAWSAPLFAADKPAAKATTAKATATKAASFDMKAAEASMKKSDCFACHQVKRKVVGPSYVDIAKKYKADKNAVANLSKKVKDGGSGVWGAVPMAAHKNLKDAEIEAMVRWVLAQK